MAVDEIRRGARELLARMNELGERLDLAQRKDELDSLERKAADPDLWEDTAAGQATLQELAQVRESVMPVLDLQQKCSDLIEMADLIASDAEVDAEMESQLQTEYDAISVDLERFELETLLSGPHDSSNAILEVNAGAGGTESCDWAQMLVRMYMRWAADNGFSVEIADETPGDVAGVKSVTMIVSGPRAYGYLQAERGVHRLVRISPFDANKRRHTSFASVDVVPEIEEAEEVAINPDDLRVDTFRSSGAGGQHVNKTDSAVRLTHLPTGIVVSCQNERSQHKNRAVAMKVLQSRLMEVERRESNKRMAEIRGEQQSIEWGSQIRSYVFQPYTMAKDHRTGAETGDIIKVMDGGIDLFIQAYLHWQSQKSSE
ncbi:MAG: peptide chain release factor 2 [Chthonomonadales bacterium]